MQTFDRMYPQAELENYKLQVELLQEKLQRSEENRQQLEHKLDKVLHKRNEIEKSMRQKTRQKYQEFLDDQKKRNERNRMLVQMLERVDQQTAAMSARSERLKMMKLQYQMYFAKLVQKQTMQCLQQSTTPTAIPVLVPSAAAASTVTLPTHATTTATATVSATAASLQAAGNQMSEIPTPRIDSSPTQQWTLAMATPTHAGMLLSTTPAKTATTMPDYLQYPIGYMPRTNVSFDDLYAAAAATRGGEVAANSTNIYDLRASLRALDNENVDLPERFMTRRTVADLRHKSTHDMDNYDDETLTAEYQRPTMVTRQAVATATLPPQKTPAKDNSLHGKQQQQQQLPNVGAAGNEFDINSSKSTSSGGELSILASGSLTFDKLPQTSKGTAMSLPVDEQSFSARQLARSIVAAGKPQKPTREWQNIEQDVGCKNEDADDDDDDALPNARVTSAKQEKSSSVTVNNEKTPTIGRRQEGNIEAHLAAMKIDDPWRQQQQQVTMAANVWQPEERLFTYKPEVCTNAIIQNSLTNEPNDENATVPVDEQKMRADNQLSTAAAAAAAAPTANSTTMPLEEALAKPTLSIENIENAIYGELLNPTAAVPLAPATATAVAAIAEAEPKLNSERTVAQGLFENLVTTQAPLMEEPDAYEQQQQPEGNYANYDAMSYTTGIGDQEPSVASESYEPSYATIDGNANAQIAAASAEPIYSEIGNTNNYQQYNDATDVNGSANGANGGDVAADQTQQQQQQQQDSYGNMDYSNYDATQYAEAYDPNAYPGYIYDEATGQYIADPNATAYATDESYAAAAQAYDDSAANYDYNAAATPYETTTTAGIAAEVNSEGYTMENVQPLNDNPAATAATTTTNADVSVANFELTAEAALTDNIPQTEASTTPPTAVKPLPVSLPTPTEAAPAPQTKIVKPTSILATSTDKQAAASNDAQQQKKKKRVNFVDSSETDESSSAKPVQGAADGGGGGVGVGVVGGSNVGGGNESDFDFSTSSEAQN